MKIRIRKLQQGGGFPPLVSSYVPVTNTPVSPLAMAQNYPTIGLIAGVTSGTTGKSSGSSTSGGGIDLKDTMSLLKDMKGLDNDVMATLNSLQQTQTESDLFGDSSSVVNQYYRNIALVNKVAQSKEMFDKAKKRAEDIDSLNELAITPQGGLWVRDNEGKLGVVSIGTYNSNKDKLSAITNEDLLYERQHNPNMKFQNSLLESVEGSTSTKQILDTINNITSKMGSTDITQDGFVTSDGSGNLQGDLGIIQKGIVTLKNAGQQNTVTMGVAGLYHSKVITSDQANQANAAIKAIWGALAPNQQALLIAKSDGSIEKAQNWVTNVVAKGISTKAEFTSEFQKLDDGKSSSSSNKSGKGSDDYGDLNPANKAVLMIGTPVDMGFNTGSSNEFHAYGVRTELGKASGELFPAYTSLSDASSSTVSSILNIPGTFLGDQHINDQFQNHVLIRSNEAYVMNLPVRYDATSRSYVPDFTLATRKDAADKEIEMYHIQDAEGQNKVYEKYKLPPMHRFDGNHWTLTTNYKRFMAVQVVADEQAFKNPEGASTNPTLVPVDDTEREEYAKKMKEQGGDKNYKLGRDGLFGGIFSGDKELYRATAFIPVNGDITDAMLGLKSGVSPQNAQKMLEKEYAAKNYNMPPTLSSMK